MLIEMQVKGLMIDPVQSVPIIILRDTDNQRALPIWALVVWLSGYVSLGSVVTAALFPLWVRLTRPGAPYAFYAAVALAALIVISHRANLRRLVAGTENRFGRRAGAGAGSG